MLPTEKKKKETDYVLFVWKHWNSLLKLDRQIALIISVGTEFGYCPSSMKRLLPVAEVRIMIFTRNSFPNFTTSSDPWTHYFWDNIQNENEHSSTCNARLD